ncbi:transposase OrfB [Streptococcus pneumoniae]|nr:transposase OrfB [Streptococcus pneumoniae]
MSRKGNSPDNGMMESFFGILKSEMFYGYEKNFRSLENLEQAIVDYIDYYTYAFYNKKSVLVLFLENLLKTKNIMNNLKNSQVI